MNYPAPQYAVAIPTAKTSAIWIVASSICCIATLIFIVIAAIALAVGLGVGLSTRNKGSSGGKNNQTVTNTVITTGTAATNTVTTTGTAATAAAPAGTFSILSPPVVNCVYGGSATCGCSATKPLFAAPGILQGYTARSNSWPWIVQLTIAKNGRYSLCAGTFITYRHVLTAAHCLVPNVVPSGVTVPAGVQTLSNQNEGQTRVGADIAVHPDFIGVTPFPNDIAILTLQTPVTQNSTVGLCCLSFNTTLPAVGERAVIIGWGTTTEDGRISDVLLQAVIQVENPSAACAVQSSGIQFCAGFSGTDTYQGDSGGPFMTSVDNLWTCTGIVSNGMGCGRGTVFTRVSAYEQFINNVINA